MSVCGVIAGLRHDPRRRYRAAMKVTERDRFDVAFTGCSRMQHRRWQTGATNVRVEL